MREVCLEDRDRHTSSSSIPIPMPRPMLLLTPGTLSMSELLLVLSMRELLTVIRDTASHIPGPFMAVDTTVSRRWHTSTAPVSTVAFPTEAIHMPTMDTTGQCRITTSSNSLITITQQRSMAIPLSPRPMDKATTLILHQLAISRCMRHKVVAMTPPCQGLGPSARPRSRTTGLSADKSVPSGMVAVLGQSAATAVMRITEVLSSLRAHRRLPMGSMSASATTPLSAATLPSRAWHWLFLLLSTRSRRVFVLPRTLPHPPMRRAQCRRRTVTTNWPAASRR